MALVDNKVIVVPKTVIGDRVEVRLRRQFEDHFDGELVSVRRKRDFTVCGSFAKCGGCQLQMMRYNDQLLFKRSVIEKAYRFFCSIQPQVLPVIGSPLEYAYRTKLTPHSKGNNIGFNSVDGGVLHISQCPIAVPSINRVLPKLEKGKHTYLLRDSFHVKDNGSFFEYCATDQHLVITEIVEEKRFDFEANEFFQNNRSILPSFLGFLKSQIAEVDYKYLIDAYCGVGFLGISLSDTAEKVFGIEISKRSIDFAKKNATSNNVHNVHFVDGNSDSMFDNDVFKSSVVGEELVLLMNPSRKGLSKLFMKQILGLKPKMVIYVSCNVFTQARDLSDLMKFQELSDVKYMLKTVQGFDFYPQTKHVESVAVLVRQ